MVSLVGWDHVRLVSELCSVLLGQYSYEGWVNGVKKSRQNARRCGRRNDQTTGSVNMQTEIHEMPFPFAVVLFQGRRFFLFFCLSPDMPPETSAGIPLGPLQGRGERERERERENRVSCGAAIRFYCVSLVGMENICASYTDTL